MVVLDGATLNPGDNPWDELAGLGELEVHDRTPADEIQARAAGAHILLTNKTPLDRTTIQNLPSLGFISVLATGYNVVDVEAARERGIPVSNVPEYATDAVAQHVFALILELANGVGEHDTAVKAGKWTAAPDFCFWQRPLTELAGLALGIVGVGRIGMRVAELARAFGMSVLAYSPSRRFPPGTAAFEWAEIDEIFARADVVSLHCPQTEENAGFVDDVLIARMKPGAYLINTARGGLVDEAALAGALREGRLAGAAVDVASTEPIHPDNPLLAARNCLITPHIAWAALSARRRLMQITVANVRAFLEGSPINVVNT